MARLTGKTGPPDHSRPGTCWEWAFPISKPKNLEFFNSPEIKGRTSQSLS